MPFIGGGSHAQGSPVKGANRAQDTATGARGGDREAQEALPRPAGRVRGGEPGGARQPPGLAGPDTTQPLDHTLYYRQYS